MTKRKIVENSGRIIAKVSIITIIVNTALTAFKLVAGLIGNSAAMVSDAVHSASDILSTFVVLIGVKMSSKKADSDHQYGHDRYECIASILLAIMLGSVGIGIGYSGVEKIISGASGVLTTPTMLALIASIVSIITKEWMFWYSRAAAKKTNSGALMADAWHHRSDALSSIGSFVGIGGAMIGIPILDPIASVVICLFILKATVKIFMDAISKISDRACDCDTIKSMTELIVGIKGVDNLDKLQTRLFSNRIYVDVEISVDSQLLVSQAHDISVDVHNQIEEKFPNVKHCMVHVNPSESADSSINSGSHNVEL